MIPNHVVCYLAGTVFVITEQRVSLLPEVLLLGALVLIIGFGLLIRNLKPRFLRILLYIVLVVAGADVCLHILIRATAAIPYAFHYPLLRQSIKEYDQGDYSVADGLVSNYTVSPDRATDCFLVGATRFCISPVRQWVGYHQTRARGGSALRNGVRARVLYHDSVILKLDTSD